MNFKKIFNSIEFKHSLILIFFVLLSVGMSLGFSYLRKDLRASGTIKLIKYGPLIELMKNTDNPQVDTSYNSFQTGEKGLYIRNGTQFNVNPIYYYHGEVKNNNVIFANICWLIVRTTEKGGIKLVYNGKPTNNQCIATGVNQSIGASAFSALTTLSSSGYMYGVSYNVTRDKSVNNNASYYYIFGETVSYDSSTKKYTLNNPSSYAMHPYDSASEVYGGSYIRRYTCRSSSATTCSTVYYMGGNGGSYDVAYIALTGGKTYKDIMPDTFANTNNSTIKTAVDNWYRSNMTSYTKYLEDAVWCNDRSFYSSTTNFTGELIPLWKTCAVTGGCYNSGIDYNKNILYSSAFNLTDASCPLQRDRFTVSDVSIGNGALTYPTGLLTADEIQYAGGGANETYSYSSKSYLLILNTSPSVNMRYEYFMWTMTPSNSALYTDYTTLMICDKTHLPGNVSSESVNYRTTYYLARPAVVLADSQTMARGEGTAELPYILELN